MPSCIDVAKYFLSKSSEDAGDTISNLKLQKLIYYAQGFSLALLDEPLFGEPIEAWMHGPVSPHVYQAYRDFGSGAIPAPEVFDPRVFTRKQLDLLDEVYGVYGQYSAWKLRELTHTEAPWKDNYEPGRYSREIPVAEMKKFFVENLVE